MLFAHLCEICCDDDHFGIFLLYFQVRPDVLPPLLSQGGVTQAPRVQPVEATNQKPDAQTPAPLSPIAEQPQPGVPQQPGPQGGPQFLPPTQYYTWSPLGGSPMIIPLQPSVHGSQPANQLTLPQQPLVGHEEKKTSAEKFTAKNNIFNSILKLFSIFLLLLSYS